MATFTHISLAKLGKTNFLNSGNASCFHILLINSYELFNDK